MKRLSYVGQTLTDEQVKIIKEKYSTMRGKELAKLVGVSWGKFIGNIAYLGIRKYKTTQPQRELKPKEGMYDENEYLKTLMY